MQNDKEDLSEHLRRIEGSIEELKYEHHTFRKMIARRSIFVLSTVAMIALVSTVAFYYGASNTASSEPKTSFVIENLRGDTIDTWIYWLRTDYQDLHIHLINSPHVTSERIQIIRDAIMSEDIIQIDDSLLHKGFAGSSSTYYLGWKGALESIDEKTREDLPKNLHFDVVDSEKGDVIIRLTNARNMDGFAAFTKSIVDEENHAILKSVITIYEIESLASDQLAAIVRHEIGHALGLGHSSAPEDLMAPTITTPYPYISQCAIDAVRALYDGSQKSRVVCEN